MYHCIICMKAPEIGAESSQDIFMCFEADTFDHQHTVTQQPLNPLLLELLQEVGAVAGQGVHGHSAPTCPSHSYPRGHMSIQRIKDLFIIPLVSSSFTFNLTKDNTSECCNFFLFM